MKKIVLSVFVFIMCSLLSACSFFGFGGGASDADYAMTVDGKKISMGEFSVYLYEQKTTFEQMGGSDIWDTDFNGVPAADVAKENAYTSVVYVKTACKNAKDIGVSLDDEDKAEAASLGEQIYNEMGRDYCRSKGLSPEDVNGIMEEILLHQKVMDYITKSYQPSDADYSAYIDDYIKEHPDDKSPRATLESRLREDYIRTKKEAIYQEQIEKWCENTDIEKNEAVWDQISVVDF